MQTTTFRCGHCGNLMAVGTQYLGHQVQCPTCKQVVLAPAPAPVPAPEPVPLVVEVPPEPPAPTPAVSLDHHDEHESIFSEKPSDDLFDEPPPSLTPQPAFRPEPEPLPAPTHEPPELMPALGPTPDSLPETAVVEDVPPRENLWPEPERREAPVEEPARRRKEAGTNWPLLLMVPLISYSVLATALIFYLWNRLETVRTRVVSPLEAMPDVHGDAPGVQKKAVRTWKPDDNQALAALPPGHTAKLGETVTVANLDVTPLRVERGKLKLKVRGYPPDERGEESLLLHLRFRNRSEEFAFAPLDNAFDRRWPGGSTAALSYKPFTVLQVGAENFFGGTAHWHPRNHERREWIEGRGDAPVYLDPGKTMESFVATNGDPPGAKIVPAALAHRGTLVWRVHVRQGPIDVPNRDAPIPSTTVVAVEFSAKDIVAKQ